MGFGVKIDLTGFLLNPVLILEETEHVNQLSTR